MKTKQITLLVIAAFFVIIGLPSCSGFYVEPSVWEKEEFKREVRKAVKTAVNAPGIDNGSTIIVTLSGDTLLAPKDSILNAHPERTVYVDIQSPPMPTSGISQRNIQMLTVLGLCQSFKSVKVDSLVFNPVDILETKLGHPSLKRHLATLESHFMLVA